MSKFKFKSQARLYSDPLALGQAFASEEGVVQPGWPNHGKMRKSVHEVEANRCWCKVKQEQEYWGMCWGPKGPEIKSDRVGRIIKK